MQVQKGFPTRIDKPCVLALGNFDGVHIGHQRLLEKGMIEAKRLGAKFGVFVLDPHPLKVINPEQRLDLITPKQEKLAIFEEYGVDIVYLWEFTQEFAALEPEEFVKRILQPLGVIHIVVGFNYSFGAQGKGTTDDLKQFGEKYGFKVSIIEAQWEAGQIISSSRIRDSIKEGNIELVKQMLGRSLHISGKVVTGEQRGRLLGFPTANLLLDEDAIIPKRGVYAVWSEIDGKNVNGMMNIGVKPTFHNVYMTTIEVHFFNFQGDLYEKELTVYIESFLRNEQKFANIPELCQQLSLDADHAQSILFDLEKV